MIRFSPGSIRRLFKIIRLRRLILFILAMSMATSCARPRTLGLAPAPTGGYGHQESYVELPSSIENALMTGYLVRPSGNGRHPCVILLHGKGGWWQGYIRYARKLASHGFSSLIIDYYSVHQVDLEGLTTPFVQRKLNFERQNEDIRRSVSAFSKSAHCVKNKIGLIGFSLGADKAFRTAASLPVVKAIVAYYGPYDYASLIKRRVTPLVLSLATPNLLHWKRYLERHSPTNKIWNTKASALMFHGVADGLIPVRQSLTMIKRLRARKSGAAELMLYEGVGHNFAIRRKTRREREDSIRRALLFLKSRLPRIREQQKARAASEKQANLRSRTEKQGG